MNVSGIDIVELAALLEERKHHNQKCALILGSRTGALARSSLFMQEMARDYAHTHARGFTTLSEKEQFSECYALLRNRKSTAAPNDFELFLKQMIYSVNFVRADEFLAALVKQEIFKLILYFNPDNILYDAFTAARLREHEDFVEFSLGRFPLADTLDEITLHEKIGACKVVRLYNDVEAFAHDLYKATVQKENSQCIKALLDRMAIKEVLLVGIDLTWDQKIFSALPSRTRTIWLVSEDEQTKKMFNTTYEKIDCLRYLPVERKAYEKFFTALYLQMNASHLPHPYETISQIENQLNIVQRDLAATKGVLATLQSNIDRMEKLIRGLTRKVEEAMKTNTDEEE